ncbi:MAG: hypothetical protein F4X94_07595 [Dehalococcoidia bacterium]|nr:hypothetical protein [Dehalococcoidia bacterium]
MKERAYPLGGMKWLAGSIALFLMALVFTGTVHADPPPGRCWGGILSESPLHCYVLEEAERDGIIEVDAMYGAGTELFVYLDQTEPVGDDVYQYMQRKAQARVRAVEGDDCVLEERGCSGGIFWFNPIRGYVLPYLDIETDYVDIELKHGGAEARRSEPGWAAFQQVWPAVAAGAGGASGSSGFDVSGVDTTNFPTLECLEDELNETGQSCRYALEYFPGLGIAGVRTDLGKTYVQVKASSVDDVRAQTAKQALINWDIPIYDEDEVVIIPVKYSYEELLRWKIVLNRFIHSSGNTVGIARAVIDTNTVDSVVGRVVLPIESLQAASSIPQYGYDSSTIRETIWVVGLNLEQTQKGLPQLLKQLNIPVDAVGVVGEPDQTPHKLGTRGTASNSAPDRAQSAGSPGLPGNPDDPSHSIVAMWDIDTSHDSRSEIEKYLAGLTVREAWPYLLGIVAAFVLLMSTVVLGIRRLRRTHA